MSVITEENLKKYNKLHFIGVGGSGMFPLVQILHSQGHTISGSDNNPGDTIDQERAMGVDVTIGHSAENLKDTQAVVYSAAIMQDNVELVAARERGIPTIERSEMLGLITRRYNNCVCVSGTHGKTTTTSMLTHLMLAADLDPSAVIGGKLNAINGSGRAGNSETMVVEACEYVDTFLHLFPNVSVILNIDEDHMEYFKTRENLINSFKKYLKNTKPGGTVVYNAEDEASLEMIDGYDGNTVSFGLEKGRFHAKNISMDKGCGVFDLFDGENMLGTVRLAVPGAHNVKNALAAAAACTVYGFGADTVIKGLCAYSGAERRFEYHCTVNGAVIADDYGHHPDAYKVTFDTARAVGFKRIIAIHQPHTFSRTKMLMDDFVSVLSTVDHVLVAPIYAARETNDLYNIYAEDVVSRLPNGEYCESFDKIADRVFEMAREGDLFITLGCGDIYKAAKLITKRQTEM